MRLIGLMRMAKWARKPPSAARVKLMVFVAVVCLILFGIEQIWGWPEALTPNKMQSRIAK